jgi:hypothetical protein
MFIKLWDLKEKKTGRVEDYVTTEKKMRNVETVSSVYRSPC